MTASLRGVAIGFAVTALLSAALSAQASPYVALDDPHLPIIEQLIARGTIRDPSPMVRPFRRSDFVAVLVAADSTARAAGRADPAVRSLIADYTPPAARNWWQIRGDGGTESYTSARRDLLHPGGKGDTRAYLSGRVDAVAGNLALVSRVLQEPRIRQDPDWPGVPDSLGSVSAFCCSWRFPEAYVSAQFEHVHLFYGQMERNWGPVGVPGIPLSNAVYSRPELGFELRFRDIQLQSTASQLQDADSSGAVIHRYFFTHRLGVRLTDQLVVALWETTVLAGRDRSFDARYRNPLTLLVLANEYGLADRGNTLGGLDVSWQPDHRVTLQGQFALDDYAKRSSLEGHPSRYAFTIEAFGPLAGTTSYRALYTQASSLAFRTFNPFENFTDQGVGLGRNFADDDQTTIEVGIPVTPRWLVTPELTLLRQGEGAIDDPYPATREARLATPALFIGTVQRTWRTALRVSGVEGPLRLRAQAGWHHITNAGHIPGSTDDQFVGEIMITLGLGLKGVLR